MSTTFRVGVNGIPVMEVRISMTGAGVGWVHLWQNCRKTRRCDSSRRSRSSSSDQQEQPQEQWPQS